MFTLDEAGPAYQLWLAQTGHAEATKGLYGRQVAAFLAWLQAQEVERPVEYAGVLVDPFVRDYAVRDYRRHQLVGQKCAPATVETAVSAIGSFYDWIGLGKPKVPRTSPQRAAPKSLPLADRRRAPRAPGTSRSPPPCCSPRCGSASAPASTSTTCGSRPNRPPRGTQRQGRTAADRAGASRRRRRAAATWIAARAERAEHRHIGQLRLSREVSRLSVRRIQSLIAHIGQGAGVELSPHILRHTFARNFLDQGGDLAENIQRPL